MPDPAATHASPTAASQPDHPSQPLLDGVAQAELWSLRPAGSFGLAIADAWADYIAESASFVAGRLRQDARTQHAILKCRAPGELQAIQAAFLQKAIDDYVAEVGRMTRLARKTAESMSRRQDKRG